MDLLKLLFAGFCLLPGFCSGAEQPLYLQPNTTQLFTELYQAYGLSNPPARTFFEDALYLDQSTQPSIVPLQPANQAIFRHAGEHLAEFHRQMGDLELYIDPKAPAPFFYTAVGSKQLLVALAYAIAMSEPDKKFLFVEQAPFYSGHPNAVTGIFNYPNSRFLAFHDPAEIKLEPGEQLVEFVTSPNNPDGKFRAPLTEAKIIIADFVFASTAFGHDGSGYQAENLAWIKKARERGSHLFSFNSASKQFGKTGTRCGYIWYPMHDPYAASIFSKFFGFISASTVAGGTTGLAEFLDLIQALLALPDKGKALRQDGNKSLIKRHELFAKELLARYPGTTIISIPGSPTLFAKLKDPRLPSKKASDLLFEDFGVVVNNGEPMGESNEYIRLNLSGYSDLLAAVLNRMSGGSSYKAEELLLTASRQCSRITVRATGGGKALHIANPGDCLIDADSSDGTVEIQFPPFINYLGSRAITVKKIDTSPHPVVIDAGSVRRSLTAAGQELRLQWVQPLYLDGRWEEVH